MQLPGERTNGFQQIREESVSEKKLGSANLQAAATDACPGSAMPFPSLRFLFSHSHSTVGHNISVVVVECIDVYMPRSCF